MNPIDASELILNNEQRIYHIDLSAEYLADTVITVGDPNRVELVSKYFDEISFKTAHREFISHTGRIGKKNITVISSGIGPDNIDIVMNELDAVANIDFKTRTVNADFRRLDIFRLGTSGSMQADIDVDNMVVSSHGIGLDNLLHFYTPNFSENEKQLTEKLITHLGFENEKISPYVVEGSSELLAYFNTNFFVGMTATCPGFYAPQGRVVKANLKFPTLVHDLSTFNFEQKRITNFEMETSAIFGLGKIFGHRCLSINTIVANRVNKTFSKNAPQSIDNMIKTSLEIIEKI